MSGNAQAIKDRLGEAAAHVHATAYSTDVAALNEIVERLSRNPAATVTDQALLGRIRASARLLDQPKRLKVWAERRQYRVQNLDGHLGRGCLND